MASRPDRSNATAPRRAAADLIEAVLENMRSSLEPLKYSTLAPSRYLVYLHADEFMRLEGILPILQQQTVRALDEEMASLNRRPPVRRYLDRLFGTPPPVENVAREWHVEFHPDPDGELGEGDLLICSELLLPDREEPGAGQRTRRITTVHIGPRTTRREHTYTPEQAEPANVLARLELEDATGRRQFDIVRDSVTVGRGGIAYPVDLRINSSVDVSREHLRIRRDPQTGLFFVVDLSSLGTTLNGRRLPRGYEEVDGAKRENHVETQLADGARLGLAETVYVDFHVVPRR